MILRINDDGEGFIEIMAGRRCLDSLVYDPASAADRRMKRWGAELYARGWQARESVRRSTEAEDAVTVEDAIA